MGEDKELILKLRERREELQEVVGDGKSGECLAVVLDKPCFELQVAEGLVLGLHDDLVEDPLEDDGQADEEDGDHLGQQAFLVSLDRCGVLGQE